MARNTGEVNSKEVLGNRWSSRRIRTERVQVIYSETLAAQQQKQLEKLLSTAEVDAGGRTGQAMLSG